MRTETLLIKSIGLIAITLILFSHYIVISQNNTSRVYYAGIEAIEEHIYGNNTIILAYPNPKVYFSYRNVHVVPMPPSLRELRELYDKVDRAITAGVLPRRVFEEKLELLRRSLNDENIAPGDILLNILLTRNPRAEETTNVGSVDVSDLAPPFYIVDLTNKSTSQVARIVGEVFSDMSNLTIVICDARLKKLQDFYNEAIVRDNLYDLDSQLIEELRPVMIKTANALELRNCFAYMEIGGGVVGVVIPWWTKLAIIGITREYRDCADIIEPYVRKMADIARKYIPDEIPLYVMVRENMDPILFPPEPGLNIKNVALAVGIAAVATTILVVVVRSIVKKPKS